MSRRRRRIIVLIARLRGGDDDEGVSLDDPRTWRCAAARRLLHDDALAALVAAVRRLGQKPGKHARDAKASAKGVDLDELLWLVYERFEAAIGEHARRLREAFARFDPDRNGLDFDEVISWSNFYFKTIASEQLRVTVRCGGLGHFE